MNKKYLHIEDSHSQDSDQDHIQDPLSGQDEQQHQENYDRPLQQRLSSQPRPRAGTLFHLKKDSSSEEEPIEEQSEEQEESNASQHKPQRHGHFGKQPCGSSEGSASQQQQQEVEQETQSETHQESESEDDSGSDENSEVDQIESRILKLERDLQMKLNGKIGMSKIVHVNSAKAQQQNNSTMFNKKTVVMADNFTLNTYDQQKSQEQPPLPAGKTIKIESPKDSMVDSVKPKTKRTVHQDQPQKKHYYQAEENHFKKSKSQKMTNQSLSTISQSTKNGASNSRRVPNNTAGSNPASTKNSKSSQPKPYLQNSKITSNSNSKISLHKTAGSGVFTQRKSANSLQKKGSEAMALKDGEEIKKLKSLIDSNKVHKLEQEIELLKIIETIRTKLKNSINRKLESVSARPATNSSKQPLRV